LVVDPAVDDAPDGASPSAADDNPVSASAVTAPDFVLGTFRYSQRGGYHIIVGFVCPGHDIPGVGIDPHPEFYAGVAHKRSALGIFRHDIGDLDDSVFGFFGFRLTDKAVGVLQNDAATVVCT
jgi:hypothetical protein